MKTIQIAWVSLALVIVGGHIAPAARAQDEIPYTEKFFLEDCRLRARGVNDYFLPLKPGCYLLLQGEEDGETITLLITVLPHTKVVDGVRCAIMREREWVGDELVEVSWNYVALCPDTKSIFYFGEDVDIFDDGEVRHDGAWLAGNGNRAGLLMPGHPLNGSRYYQEIAPGVALDRADHISNTETVETPAGTFEDCLFVVETTPLEPGHESIKYYARGIGLVQDGILKLVNYGCNLRFAESFEPEDNDEE